MHEHVVVIVGAGPSGLSAAASLRQLSIPFIVLEREDCYASLWKKYAYDRLHLQLSKQFCELLHASFPASYPRYVPKPMFLDYLDSYVKQFTIEPFYRRLVDSAELDSEGSWALRTRNLESGEVEEYMCRFLVVATGETRDAHVPEIEGMRNFTGKIIHSTEYKNGREFKDMNVFGSGNSGMEIALALTNHGAKCSVVVRSPIQFISREMMHVALLMRKCHVPLYIIDTFLMMLRRIVYGDLTKFGIRRPANGPFLMKAEDWKYPLIDVGTCNKIKSGEIQVLPAIKKMPAGVVKFADDTSRPFNAVVFCAGFERLTNKWLKGEEYLLNEDGRPKQSAKKHWKGKNGLYCVGLSGRGLIGAAAESLLFADHINSLL